jgi:hypothetical protein
MENVHHNDEACSSQSSADMWSMLSSGFRWDSIHPSLLRRRLNQGEADIRFPEQTRKCIPSSVGDFVSSSAFSNSWASVLAAFESSLLLLLSPVLTFFNVGSVDVTQNNPSRIALRANFVDLFLEDGFDVSTYWKDRLLLVSLCGLLIARH